LLVPKLRFKEFKEEWKFKRLKEISSDISYGMNSASTDFDGINKYIRITDIDENSSLYINDPVSPLDKLDDKFLVKGNDILFARTGASTGKTYLYNKNDGKMYFAGFLIRANIKKQYNSKFIFAQTKLRKYNNWIKIMSMRSGQPGINSVEYGSYIFSITDIEEQEKIANFLSLLDKKIELQQRKIEALKIYKKGLLKKIFDDIKDNASIRLQDLYHFSYGEGNTNPDNGGIYPVYGANGKIGGFNTYNAEYSVIIGHMGAYAGNVLFEENKHFVTYNGTIALPKNIKILRPKFGYYMLLNTNLPKICAGSGMPFLSYETLNNIKVKLPDIKTQEKYEKLLDLTETKVKLEGTKLQSLNKIKKSLLQQMFI